MKTVEVTLKNGKQFSIVCDSWELEISNISGNIISYNFKKCKNIVPLYINMEEIAAVIEVISDKDAQKNT